MKGPIKINLNGYATIFPTSKGWDRLRSHVIFSLSHISSQGATDFIELRTVMVEGKRGYRDQFWQLMFMFGSEFWNGGDFAGAEILFEPLDK